MLRTVKEHLALGLGLEVSVQAIVVERSRTARTQDYFPTVPTDLTVLYDVRLHANQG